MKFVKSIFLVRILFLPIIIFSGKLCQGQNELNSINPIDAWNFELPNTPLSNFVKESQELKLSGKGFKFENGIAKLNLDTKLAAAGQKKLGKESTTWMRFMIPNAEDVDFQIPLIQKGEISIYAHLKGGETAENVVFDISGEFRKGENLLKINPNPKTNLPVGLWVQIALTSDEGEHGETIHKLYYRAERSSFSSRDTKRNYWVYLGQIEAPTEQAKTSIDFGAGLDFKTETELWIDEARLYNRKLELVDLYDISATLTGFEKLNGDPPGVVIDYSPAFSGKYVAGSPSILVLSDGTYLAKGDDYGPAVGDSELVRVYRSLDKGKTWEQIAELEGITWASLFQIKETLYMLGTSAGHRKGHAIIIKSEDNGFTWTEATDPQNGIIFSDLSYHTAPGPVVIHKGKVWKAMEDEKGIGGWGTNFRAFLLNASLDSDLLNSENWKMSDALPSDQKWLDSNFNGWLEGNAAVAPNGNMVNILRVSVLNGGGKAAIINYSEDGLKSNFDPEKNIIDFPGGSTKFFIQYDKLSERYWTLSNAVLEKHNGAAYSEALIRNTLVLMSSEDLYEWKIEDTLLYHPEIAQHAFQYPTFAFDGDHIVFVSRTAYDDKFGGAIKQHDVNYFTFHRIHNFRNDKLRKLE